MRLRLWTKVDLCTAHHAETTKPKARSVPHMLRPPRCRLLWLSASSPTPQHACARARQHCNLYTPVVCVPAVKHPHTTQTQEDTKEDTRRTLPPLSHLRCLGCCSCGCEHLLIELDRLGDLALQVAGRLWARCCFLLLVGLVCALLLLLLDAGAAASMLAECFGEPVCAAHTLLYHRSLFC